MRGTRLAICQVVFDSVPLAGYSRERRVLHEGEDVAKSEKNSIGRKAPKRDARSRDASERTRSGNRRRKLLGMKADVRSQMLLTWPMPTL